MVGNLIAFLWGFAEATLFFFVPDVALSIIALSSVEEGIVASFYALAGALVGGVLMFYWGKADIKRVTHILEKIPAIRPKDVEKVRLDLNKKGFLAILLGPTLGIPYKIYASYAHEVTSIFIFLLISIPARVIRFLFMAWITPQWVKWLFAEFTYTQQVWTVLIMWGIFYVGYFIARRK